MGAAPFKKTFEKNSRLQESGEEDGGVSRDIPRQYDLLVVLKSVLGPKRRPPLMQRCLPVPRSKLMPRRLLIPRCSLMPRGTLKPRQLMPRTKLMPRRPPIPYACRYQDIPCTLPCSRTVPCTGHIPLSPTPITQLDGAILHQDPEMSFVPVVDPDPELPDITAFPVNFICPLGQRTWTVLDLE